MYDKEGGKCIGLVDVLDIVTFAIQMYYANDPQTSLFKNYILQFSFDLETVSAVLGKLIINQIDHPATVNVSNMVVDQKK